MPIDFLVQRPVEGQPMMGRDAYGYFSEEWDDTLQRVAVIEWIPLTKEKLSFLDGHTSSREYQRACKRIWESSDV